MPSSSSCARGYTPIRNQTDMDFVCWQLSGWAGSPHQHHHTFCVNPHTCICIYICVYTQVLRNMHVFMFPPYLSGGTITQSLRTFSYHSPVVEQCQRGEEQSSSESNSSVVIRNLVCQARYSCATVNLLLWSKFPVEFNTFNLCCHRQKKWLCNTLWANTLWPT